LNKFIGLPKYEKDLGIINNEEMIEQPPPRAKTPFSNNQENGIPFFFFLARMFPKFDPFTIHVTFTRFSSLPILFQSHRTRLLYYFDRPLANSDRTTKKNNTSTDQNAQRKRMPLFQREQCVYT
jgi:hypothetical protein